MKSISRFRAIVASAAWASVAALILWSAPAAGQTRYTASWSSVDQHKTPAWFLDAKFGIYYHWGAFATAMYGSEWYPRNMYNKAGNSNGGALAQPTTARWPHSLNRRDGNRTPAPLHKQ